MDSELTQITYAKAEGLAEIISQVIKPSYNRAVSRMALTVIQYFTSHSEEWVSPDEITQWAQEGSMKVMYHDVKDALESLGSLGWIVSRRTSNGGREWKVGRNERTDYSDTIAGHAMCDAEWA